MRKRTAIVTALPLLIAGGVGAFAFISQTISANGSGHTSSAKPVTGAVTGIPTDFAPGDVATIKLHVTNPNNYAVHVSDPHFVVAPVAGCDARSFTIDNVTGPTDIPSGESDAFAAKLHFVNLPDAEQSGCLDKAIQVSATAA